MERRTRTVIRNEPKLIPNLHRRGWARPASNNGFVESEFRFYKRRRNGQLGHIQLPSSSGEIPATFIARTSSAGILHVVAFDRHRLNRRVQLSKHAKLASESEHRPRQFRF